MKKQPIPNKEEQSIIQMLSQVQDGLQINEIEAQLPNFTSRRTLQRRLSHLEKSGYLHKTGLKSGTKYRLAQSEELLSLSAESKRLKARLSKPLSQRERVPYHPEFLFSYKPNQTFYLPEKTRQYLHSIGQRFRQKLEPGTYVKKILHRLLIDLSWNSSRLEGNTYSLLETERLIEYGMTAVGKDAFETQMILNHKAAIEFVVDQCVEMGLCKYTILNIHAILSDKLLANPRARGYLRQIPVGIGKTVYQPPVIPQLIEQCFETIIDTAKKIHDPFEQSFFLMVQLPYLQPFEDVNKRVSRITANIPLMQHNLSPLSFIDVPQNDYVGGLLAVYELNQVAYLRDVYVWAYERSASHYQVIQDTLTAPNLIALRYKKTLHELVKFVVMHNIGGAEIIKVVRDWTATHTEKSHAKQFALLAEREIASLHTGNIAVYQIPPEVFLKWDRVKH